MITELKKQAVIFGYKDKTIVGNTKELAIYYILCDIQKWLREKHGIHITINYNTIWKGYYFQVLKIRNHLKTNYLKQGESFEENYEKSLEKALFEALKLI